MFIDVNGRNEEDEKPTHQTISWSYPEIYDKSNLSILEISLCHTRASDNIRVKYESDRDGWIIEQASKHEWAEDEDDDPDWQEVAFISAWGRTEEREEIESAWQDFEDQLNKLKKKDSSRCGGERGCKVSDKTFNRNDKDCESCKEYYETALDRVILSRK